MVGADATRRSRSLSLGLITGSRRCRRCGAAVPIAPAAAAARSRPGSTAARRPAAGSTARTVGMPPAPGPDIERRGNDDRTRSGSPRGPGPQAPPPTAKSVCRACLLLVPSAGNPSERGLSLGQEMRGWDSQSGARRQAQSPARPDRDGALVPPCLGLPPRLPCAASPPVPSGPSRGCTHAHPLYLHLPP